MNVYDQLKRDEGVRARAYPDPLTGGDPWTIGVGHTGPEVRAGLLWNDDQIMAALHADVALCTQALDRNLSWWMTLTEPRQAVLIGMAFNMGIAGLMGFRHTLWLIRDGDYEEAAEAMLQSKWAAQVGERAKRLAQQMATGEWM